MDMISRYYEHTVRQLETAFREEKEALQRAAGKVADCIRSGGLIRMFGCGHSHMLTEEFFYRAGGLANVKPIFVEPLMLHLGAVTSSALERKESYVLPRLETEPTSEGDIVIVISTSGRNPVPIEVALWARSRGLFTIGLTSLAYSGSMKSRHSSGLHLCDAVDLAIDNKCEIGDAVLTHPAVPDAFAPTSTVIGAALLQAVFAEAIRTAAESGVTPPVFRSGNLDGADVHNNNLIEQYKQRIPLLS